MQEDILLQVLGGGLGVRVNGDSWGVVTVIYGLDVSSSVALMDFIVFQLEFF